MIAGKLNKLFGVDVAHSFFANGTCSCLSFLPSAATQQMMSSFGCIQRSTYSGFELYAPNVRLSFISKFSGFDYFEFVIHNSNPDLYIFTDLPVDQLGQLFYSSRTSSLGSDKSITLTPFTEPQQTVPVFGRFRVFFDSLANTGSVQFRISYQARATEWQYYIINNSQVALENPAISGTEGISFEGPQQATLLNGQRALLFSSGGAMLSLSEKPRYKFNLVNKRNGLHGNATSAGTTIYKGLPSADPGRIFIKQVNNTSHVSSPMYVYI